MQLNNSINNAQPSFNARLYLQNINKKDLEFFKGIAKDFHKSTKDLKGTSFSLKDNADEFVLRSNHDRDNFGSLNKQDVYKIDREGFVNALATIARTLRTVEAITSKSKSINGAESKIVTYKVDGKLSDFDAAAKWLKDLYDV